MCLRRSNQACTAGVTREGLSSHAGQVAFPGGKFDRDDRDATACALREAFEETGLEPHFVRPIGYLDPYHTRTGFRVIPVVALVDTGFALAPAPDEVDAVCANSIGGSACHRASGWTAPAGARRCVASRSGMRSLTYEPAPTRPTNTSSAVNCS